MDRRRRWTPHGWMWRSFVVVLVVVGVAELTVELALLRLPGLGAVGRVIADLTVFLTIAAFGLWLLVVRPLLVGLKERNRKFAISEERLRAQTESLDLSGQIHRALEMAVTEPDVMAVADRAIDVALPGRSAELLMADSSQAHLAVVMATAGGGPGCPVSTPSQCPAVRVGHVLAFRSSCAIDACPKLQNRDRAAPAAVCVPITVLGHAAGVLHVTAGEPFGEAALDRLRDLGAAVGQRLSLVRALSDSQRQAASDPLTGLMNRRALEDRVADLDRRQRPYALITLDLDRFKLINDTNGHAAGDQALRLFARAMKEVVRTDDLIARYGGEEFVVVLPEAGMSAATSLAERLRVHLLELLAAGTVPSFTVSAGVADTTIASQFHEIMAAADACLFRAKDHGRDRVEVATVDAA